MVYVSNRIINPKWFCDCVYRDEMDVNSYFYGFREHFAKEVTYDLVLSVLEYNYDYKFIKERMNNTDNPKFVLLNKCGVDTNIIDTMNNIKASFDTYKMMCNYLDEGKMGSINYGDFKKKMRELFDKYCNNIKYTI